MKKALHLGAALATFLGAGQISAQPQGNLTLTQEPATKLINILLEADVEKVEYQTGFDVIVKEVRCVYTPRGFIWAACNFEDHQGNKYTLLPIQAHQVMEVLQEAGVEGSGASDDIQDPLVELSVQAESIHCTRGGLMHLDRCSITL